MTGLEAIPAIFAAISSAAATAAPYVAVGSALVGAGVSAYGMSQAAEARAENARAEGSMRQWEAAQMDAAAKDERASAQRDAFELQRRKKLALSTLQNRSAASGFTATDPTTLAIADEIEKYGTLQEQMAMYGGDAKARDLTMASAGKRYTAGMLVNEAQNYQRAGRINAIGTVMSGVGDAASSFARYWKKDGFNPTPTTRTSRYGDSPLSLNPADYG